MSDKTPRPASTIVVIRDRALLPAEARNTEAPKAGFEVFLVKRHGRSGFMANAHVFPGGRVEEGDLAFAARLPAATRALCGRLLDGAAPEAEAAAFALAAIRETAEECGLLLARDAEGEVPGADVAEAVFAALHEDKPFEEELTQRGLVPDVEALAPLSWWITPEAEPRRFDTRFFLARAPAAQRARADLKETTEGEWLSPKAALAAYAEGRVMLAPPTLATLEDLAEATCFDEACQVALRPVRPICPLLVTGDDGLVLALPGDPLHAEAERATRASRTRIVMTPEGRFRSDAEPRLATSGS